MSLGPSVQIDRRRFGSARRISNGTPAPARTPDAALSAARRNRPRHPTRTRSRPSHRRVAPRGSAASDSPPHRIGTGAGGWGSDHHLGHLVVLAGPRHASRRHNSRNAGIVLVQPFAAVAELPAPSARTPAHPSHADSQRYATVGDFGGSGDHLGHLQKGTGRSDVHRAGEPQPTGHRGHRTDQHPGIRPGGLGVPTSGLPVGESGYGDDSSRG